MIFSSPGLHAASALFACLVFVAFLLKRTKRLDRADAGSLFVALGAGLAIPKGLFLCSYLFSPDPQSVSTKLRGYEKDIFAAGVLIIFLALASLWSVCEKIGEESR
jgi:hypothetical protein